MPTAIVSRGASLLRGGFTELMARDVQSDEGTLPFWECLELGFDKDLDSQMSTLTGAAPKFL
jgi:hypothetical protein